MRASAEFIMRGRAQAALVAVCGNFIPLISPAAVGLVGLRKGLPESLLVGLWALLPSVLAFYISDLSPLVIAASIAGVFVVVLAAEVLKTSISWSFTLVVVSAVSGGLAIALGSFVGNELSSVQQTVAELFTELQQEKKAPVSEGFIPGETFIVGLIGYVVALNAVVSLLLARWWQALLYNTGGFQQEFHQLRLGLREAAILLAAVVFCQFSSVEYFSWAELLGLPLLISGIALVHCVVAQRKMGGHWLVILYIGLILINPLSLVLVTIGFIDSIVNFRSRLVGKADQ